MSHRRRPMHPLLAGLIPDVTTPESSHETPWIPGGPAAASALDPESSVAINGRIVRAFIAGFVKDAETFLTKLERLAERKPNGRDAQTLALVAQFVRAMDRRSGDDQRTAAELMDPYDTSGDGAPGDDEERGDAARERRLAYEHHMAEMRAADARCTTCDHTSVLHVGGDGACMYDDLKDHTPCACGGFTIGTATRLEP